MNIANAIKDKWWLFALAFIFLYSFYIRSLNIVPDKMLSFDPIYQYRFTYYFANWGHLPIWDELTYYVGRITDVQPFMHYVTSLVYWLLGSFLKMSLMTMASYMSAVYGALIAVAAFLLGKELSNNYGGLLAGALMGTAPQILVRTFGSSYDTDQLVLFFLILTLYLGFHAIRKKSIANFSLAIIGFVGFMLLWQYFLYSILILFISVIIYAILEMLPKERKIKIDIVNGFKTSLSKTKDKLLILILILISIFLIGLLNNVNLITNFLILIGFAQSAEQWIVNISIAELQPFNIFSLDGWILSMGRFITGDAIINNLILIFFFLMMVLGIFRSFKKDKEISAFLITLLIVSIYSSSRGIRFTEFTSGLFIILIGVGFGLLTDWMKDDNVKKATLIGLGVFIILVAMTIGVEMGKQLGPDINSNWDTAWDFLKTQTPEFSIVGTWWDPGHMITGLAERRAYADGAHCQLGNDGQHACLYTINDRITDLGKIMATSDENESMNLIRKYQGDSPKIYWIASDDLIGKFQWLQYFGTGCDARVDEKCPLYIQIGQESQSTDENGNIVIRNYGSILLFQGLNVPIPIYVQDINGAIFDEVMYYSNGNVSTVKWNETEKQILVQALKPLETQLNFRFTNQSIPLTVWVPQHYSYIVIIPQNLRESVFTKMFMLEGQGLEHFKQVFRNEQVKIYEVI
jgi:asparagine N-glycosylation enzyme membrane subunit Stt3